MISAIIKLPNIQSITFADAKTARKIQACKNSLGRDFSAAYDNLYRTSQQRVHNYLNARTKILGSYIVNTEDKNRKKRGVLSFFGNLGISLAIGGITEYQIQKIKRHVEVNKDSIDEVKRQLAGITSGVTAVNKKVIGIANDISEVLPRLLMEEDCKQFFNTLAHERMIRFNEAKEVIDNVLWTALSGANNLELTPKMIDIQTLEAVIEKTEVLRDTIFDTHTHLLYSLTRTHLVEINEGLQVAHFILDIPLIESQEETTLFRSSQVGMHVTGNLCAYLEMSVLTYEKDEHELQAT